MGSFSFAFTKDAFFVCAFLCIMLLDATWAGEGRFPCQPHGMVSQDHSRLVSVVIRCTLHTCHLWNVWLLWVDMSAVWQVCLTWNEWCGRSVYAAWNVSNMADACDLTVMWQIFACVGLEVSAMCHMYVTWWCGRCVWLYINQCGRGVWRLGSCRLPEKPSPVALLLILFLVPRQLALLVLYTHFKCCWWRWWWWWLCI